MNKLSTIAIALLLSVLVTGQTTPRLGAGRKYTSIERVNLERLRADRARFASERRQVTMRSPHEKPSWDDQIIAGSQLTVLELARRIIPGIKRDPQKAGRFTGTDLSSVRLLDGVNETGMELESESKDESEISEPDYLWLNEGGDRMLILLLEVDRDGLKLVIGLFKVSPRVALLDAVTIAQDMHVDVDTGAVWLIHPQHQAFAVHSWHDNSDESFDAYAFVSVIGGELRAVADVPAFSGSTTYSAAKHRVCKTATAPKFQFAPSPKSGYFDLIVSETTKTACHRDSEKWSWETGVVSQKSSRRVWRWNAKTRQYRSASPRVVK